MNKKEANKIKQVLDDIFWMAIRYAHGRHTYAPYVIREAYKKTREVFPDFKLKNDDTIEVPKEKNFEGTFRSDWLDDLFKL